MLQTLFALLAGIAGWHYMFYSRAAASLAPVESHSINRWRVRLRRIGGASMLLLGICFFAGFNTIDLEHPTPAFLLIWFAVLLFLVLIVALGFVDLGLTWRLRRILREARPS